MTLVNQSFGDFLGVTITGAVALVSGVILLFDYRNLLFFLGPGTISTLFLAG